MVIQNFDYKILTLKFIQSSLGSSKLDKATSSETTKVKIFQDAAQVKVRVATEIDTKKCVFIFAYLYF